MPKTFGGAVAFAVSSFVIVLVGVSILNRAQRQFPFLARMTGA